MRRKLMSVARLMLLSLRLVSGQAWSVWVSAWSG
jgi:hypothetical protein